VEEYIKKYRKQLCVLVFTAVFTIIGMIAGLIFTRPVFTSSASYIVADTSGFRNEIIPPDEIREFFRHDYYTDHLYEKTAGKFSASDIKKMVKIKPNRHSPHFRVTVTCKSATDVYFLQKTIETSNRSLTREMSDEYFLVIQVKEAPFPENPVRPGFGIIVSVFAVLGAAASVVFIKHRQELFTVKNTTESLLRFQVPVIARIPVYRRNSFPTGKQNSEFTRVFLRNSGISSAPEEPDDISGYNPDRNTIMIGPQTSIEFFDAFRQFYSTVSKIDEDEKHIILITSADIGAGKTTAALNLGITAAAEGKSVLLVDCNLRNRRLMRAFNIEQDSPGLYNMIFERLPARDAILFTEYHSLCVLPQGNTRGINPLTLLTNPEMRRKLLEIREMFDYVIIDSPPVNAFPDALALAGVADLVFLTVRNKITSDDECEKALKSLELSEIDAAGFILNEAELYTDTPAAPSPNIQTVSRNRFISGFGL